MSPRRRTSTAALLAGALCLALALAGCVGLPTSGGVVTQEIDSTPDQDTLLARPESPQAGATPEEIIQGFIRAGRGPQEGYRVAREFLTDDFRAEWKPNAGVAISDSPIVPEQTGPSAYRVEVSVLARVNATGNYADLAAPEPLPLDYQLELNEDDEWRISSAPDGTVLTQIRFTNTFKPIELYFLDASGDFLVPDLRWFTNTPSIKDRIVSELLAGPSAWLGAGVLVTAFPNGTRQGEPVLIEGGQATVDLSSEVRAQSGPAKQQMLQQLTASLGALASVRSVRITVGGLPLPIPEGGSQPERVLTVGSNPLVMADGNFGFLNGSNVSPISDISSKVEALAPAAVTLGREHDAAAVLSATGTAFVSAGRADPLPVDARPGLIAPGLDPERFLWSITADGGGGLLIFDAEGAVQQVPISLPSGARVVSLDVSRDGSRLLLALQTPEGPQLLVWGIVRDNSLAPVRLGDEPLALVVGDAPILDVTWVDGVTVGVLSQPDGTSAVDLYQLGGQRSSLEPLADAVRIAGGNGIDGIRLLDSAGLLFRPSSTRGWQSSSVPVSLLGTQQ